MQWLSLLFVLNFIEVRPRVKRLASIMSTEHSDTLVNMEQKLGTTRVSGSARVESV